MIKAFLFDIGNVLAFFDHQRAISRLLPRCSASAEEIRAAVLALVTPLESGLMETEDFLLQVSAAIHFRGPPEELAEAYTDIFQLNEPMWELVRELAPRYPLYFFSNTSELHLDFLQRRFPEMALFTDGIFSMRVGAMKPDPQIYHAALALLKVAPGEIFYMDDLEANLTEAQRQGFQTHHYLYQQHEALLAEVGRVLGN